MNSRIVVALLLCSALGLTAGCAQTAYSARPSIFYDDFTPEKVELRNAWQNNGRGAWIVQRKLSALPGCDDGCFRQNSEDPRALNSIATVKAPQFADGIIETKVRLGLDVSIAETADRIKDIKSFMGSGIVFRMQDENNFYMFRLAGEEGAVLGKMVNGQWVDLGNPRRVDFLESGRIRPNTWYKLKVAVRGPNIQCFIDDNPVVSLTDSSFTVGKFGLTTFKTAADFEYIDVFDN